MRKLRPEPGTCPVGDHERFLGGPKTCSHIPQNPHFRLLTIARISLVPSQASACRWRSRSQPRSPCGQQLGRLAGHPCAARTGHAPAHRRTYPDGTYRGFYSERGEDQVAIEFVLEQDVIKSAKFRGLSYKEADCLEEDAAVPIQETSAQYHQLIDHLVGKELSAMYDLYQPERIVTDTDTFAGATLRSNKMLVAIQDALSRGVYSAA